MTPTHCGNAATLALTMTVNGRQHVSYRCTTCKRKVGPFLDQRRLRAEGVDVATLPQVWSQLREETRRHGVDGGRPSSLRAFWASGLGQGIKARHRVERERRARAARPLPPPRLVKKLTPTCPTSCST